MQCFHCSGKNDICMYAWTTKCGLCNFDDPAYDLNALIFSYKTGIVQYKDD